MKSTKYFTKIITQKAQKYLTLWMKNSEKEFFWFWPIIPNYLSHLFGIVCLFFFQEFAFIIPFKAWFEIITSSKEVGTFSSLLLPVIIKQTYLFVFKSECPVFHFVNLDGTILNLIQKFANKTKMCHWYFRFFF